ncbi:MCP four helix bundle domain-containing protein [Tepidibacillus marianensis]|uniref:CHASE3 domain-containing protein n=1 Tax=Tepidibacillus marianensis TaxID=3131995 RepID=UPI0030CBE2CC
MKMTLGRKLIGSFLLMAILIGFVSGMSYYNIKKLDNSYSDVMNRRFIVFSNLKNVQVLTFKQAAKLQMYMLQRDKSLIDELKNMNRQSGKYLQQTLPLVDDKDMGKKYRI